MDKRRKNRIEKILNLLDQHACKLVAVTKTRDIREIQELYSLGLRDFGENRVQELTEKEKKLPKDIKWHFIGHLQTNKVKYVASYVSLVHSIDSIKLMKEIDRQGKRNNRVIDCLFQIHIAKEKSKYGIKEENVDDFVNDYNQNSYPNINVLGIMGMATNTTDEELVRDEFIALRNIFEKINEEMIIRILSMGMSNDFPLALNKGSNMVRLGSILY